MRSPPLLLRLIGALVALLVAIPPAYGAEVVFWHKFRGAERAALESVINDWNLEHPDTPVVPMAIPAWVWLLPASSRAMPRSSSTG